MQKVPILIFILLLTAGITAFQYKSPKEKLQWLTLQEAEQKNKVEARPILIDLYTDWCGWCKVMDRKTYTNQQLIQYLNKKFYVVKLNAETKSEIIWKGKSYNFNPTYRTNDIALSLTNGELAYPTTVIVPIDNSTPQPIAGMLEVQEMEMITKYFGENLHGNIPFDDYAKKFKPSWK